MEGESCSYTGREQLRLESEAGIFVGFGKLNSDFHVPAALKWEDIYECGNPPFRILTIRSSSWRKGRGTLSTCKAVFTPEGSCCEVMTCLPSPHYFSFSLCIKDLWPWKLFTSPLQTMTLLSSLLVVSLRKAFGVFQPVDFALSDQCTQCSDGANPCCLYWHQP